MNDLNMVIVEGKLTRDPEVAIINEETIISKFSIASNRNLVDRARARLIEDTSFFRIEAWGNAARACNDNLKKGRGVRVVGRLKQATWTDESDGNRMHEKVYIVAEHVEFQPYKPKSKRVVEEVESEPVRFEPEEDSVLQESEEKSEF